MILRSHFRASYHESCNKDLFHGEVEKKLKGGQIRVCFVPNSITLGKMVKSKCISLWNLGTITKFLSWH